MESVKGMSPIFRKTFLLSLLLFGIVAMLVSAMAGYLMHERMVFEFRSKGKAIAVSLSEASQEVLLNRDAAVAQSMIDNYLDIEGVKYVYVEDSSSEIIAHTFVPQIPSGIHRPANHAKGTVFSEVLLPKYGDVLDVCTPILAGYAGYVHVGMDLELVESYFMTAFLDMQMLLIAVFVLCTVVLYKVVGRVLDPLAKLTDYAGKLAQRDFSAEVDITSSDEIGTLARTMQGMASQLSLLFSEMHTEVAKSTQELRRNLSYQSAIIDNLADGLLVVDNEGGVTLANPAVRGFLDIDKNTCLGREGRNCLPAEVIELIDLVVEMDSGVVTAEVPLTEGRTGKALGSNIEHGDTSLGGVILIRDITHEKELDRLKTNFISTVSHELRTPMTSVLGFTKIIGKKLEADVFPAIAGDDRAERATMQIRGNMDVIVTEAERLTDLINDVLDIAKMESGKVQWNDGLVNLLDIARHSVDSIRGFADTKGIVVELEHEDDLPSVMADSNRMIQVMVNLLSNAVKFMDSGRVVCSLRREGGMIRVDVADQGVGIRKQDLPLVFEKFKQAGDTLTEKPTGTGLGLPICREIIKRHGGEIWAESTKGEGSVFSFTVPVAAEQATVYGLAEPDAPLPEDAQREIRSYEGKAMMVECDCDPKATPPAGAGGG